MISDQPEFVPPKSDNHSGWLVKNGKVLASLEICESRRSRAVGLLGREGIEGAILLSRSRSVHSFGMKFDLDVAFLNVDGIVVRTMLLHRNRVTLPVWRACCVIEAEAGAFGQWDLSIGDELEVRRL